jgi:ribosome-associated toxin RatA of RatAB toxin-antitoxin module
MQKFTVSVFINRPQQDVFDFLSNAANYPQWMPLLQSGEWASAGEPGVGSTFKGTMKVMGKEMALETEITRWDSPNCLSMKFLKAQFPFESMEYVYKLKAENGGTRVTLDGEYEMAAMLGFAAGLMGKTAAKSNGNELNTLKQLLEAD